MLLSYKSRMNLDLDQASIFDVMSADLQLITKNYNSNQLLDFKLHTDYAMQDLKQTIF